MAKRVRTGITIVALLSAIFAGVLLLPEQVSPQAYKAALFALQSYRTLHPEENPRYLAVVDYSKPSYLKRMALIELKTGEQSFFRVAHGKNSGELYAVRFSDTPESNMSSLGLFRVHDTYSGDHGKAVRLEGLESTVNGNAFMRDIVLHSAGYVSMFTIIENLLTFNGPRIGRSNGCFVVATGDIVEVAKKLENNGFIYVWRAERKRE
ncbi:MAG: murein L,D-transpeptidase catalytic domain family protein [Chlorobiaceae bacterium]|nr:murein L,D-transpeptidase catalytic domain family protein [Chlorobiaceae bacterium]